MDDNTEQPSTVAIDHKIIEDYILAMPRAVREYPFGSEVAVYKASRTTGSTDDAKMFALIAEDSNPVRLSLKCDPQLSEVLRDKYETVMAGYHLNKKHWNTMLMTGQMPWLEVQDLIRHSYNLVTGADAAPVYVTDQPGQPKSK